MKHKKSFYKKLNHCGYSWSGFWDRLHWFSKRIGNNGNYMVCGVSESDINDGSYKFMLDKNLTRKQL